jgi:thymidylate kinase
MPDEQGFVLVLDGLPSAGKTSVGRILADRSWLLLPEIAALAENAGFPIGERGTIETDNFILSEQIRQEERASILRERGLKIVLDGSHISNMAFAAARQFRNGSKGFELYKEYFERAMSMHTVLKPDLYVTLEISVGESIIRQVRKPRSLRTLDESFLFSVRQHLDEFHRRYHVDRPRLVLGQGLGASEIVAQLEEVLPLIRSRRASVLSQAL